MADPLVWGVFARALGNGQPVSQADALSLSQRLGVRSMRCDVGWSGAQPLSNAVAFASTALASGIRLLPAIIAIPSDYASEAAAYSACVTLGQSYSSAMAGTISVFELANELDLNCINASVSGISSSDYNATSYAICRGIIRGLLDGIRAGNPAAKGVVNTSWDHTGFLQRLLDDGVSFDYPAIHFYQNQSTQIDSTLSRMSAWGKPIWITEFGLTQSGWTDAQASSFMTTQMRTFWCLRGIYNIQTAYLFQLYTDTVNDTTAYLVNDDLSLRQPSYANVNKLISMLPSGSL